MRSGEERGPEVDSADELYRAVHLPDWWNSEINRVRSAAFNWPSFSTNIASIIGEAGAIEHLHEVLKCPDGGIVGFSCGLAKQLGFDPRQEPDPNYPANNAHANVYYDGSTSSRKRRAKELALACQIVRSPQFGQRESR